MTLRISRWIAKHLGQILGSKGVTPKPPFYIEDMSSKNPRFKGHMGPLFSQ